MTTTLKLLSWHSLSVQDYIKSSLCVSLYIEGAEWGGFEPEFTEMMGNVTVPTGRDAVLSCTVTNLGGHKVN